MKLILDASVALKIVLPEGDSDLAIKLIEDFRVGIHELIAPDVFPVIPLKMRDVGIKASEVSQFCLFRLDTRKEK